MPSAAVARDIDPLNSFLRGELAAVQTYAIALERLLPLQQQTHRVISDLNRELKAA